MKEMVIDFTNGGSVKGLHFDEFPLGFLGKMKVGRASEILWDDTAQSWFVVLPNQTQPLAAASMFSEYGTARRFEVEWLQRCLKAGVEPVSHEGIEIAREARTAIDAGLPS